ncbi:hypothetical protein [Sulfitobacter sp. R18_1]|uniref:hypothetical protein n=1 Tax=Sulfitobacter sp. R18_1 TaxID=2821104 RepID=UPI001ADC1F20|nr:hypothetical protein [Sulfitobacter sp. R18_1]MBO9428130.1 hypothetical protein [Sulfitobacter sp. R18_1]
MEFLSESCLSQLNELADRRKEVQDQRRAELASTFQEIADHRKADLAKLQGDEALARYVRDLSNNTIQKMYLASEDGFCSKKDEDKEAEG